MALNIAGKCFGLHADDVGCPPVLDLMCSHFVLTLAAQQGSQASMCAATSTA
jgi:hypothetical protein